MVVLNFLIGHTSLRSCNILRISHELKSEVAAELAERDEIRGECVIVVEEGETVSADPQVPLEEAIAAGLAAGEPKSALAKRLAREYGVAKSDIYSRVLELA